MRKPAVLLILFLVGAALTASAAEVRLFTADGFGILAPSSYHVFPIAARQRPVSISHQVTSPGRLAEGDTLILDLFPGRIYRARVDRTAVNVNGTWTVRGRIEGYPFGYVLISTTGGRSLGAIRIPERGEHYIIQSEPAALTHYLIEPLTDFPDEVQVGPPLIPPDPAGQEIAEMARIQGDILESNPLDPAQIDVMIVYTPAARTWANTSGGGIANVIAQAMGRAQLGLDNSQTLLTMSLVHSAEVNYVESGSSNTDLDRLTFHAGYDPWNRDPDRYMDEVQTWRDQYGADLVAIFALVSDTGGLGWLLSSSAGRPHFGFSLTRVQQAATGYTHIHEMGHNMGCHHHKGQNVQPGPGLFSYSAGWRWIGTNSVRYCSIMTYSSGSYFPDGQTHTQVAYFSNPNVLHQGVSTGHSADGDNSRTIREVKHAVAAYREKCGTPSSITVPTSSATGSYTVSWGTSNTSSVTYVLEEATNSTFTSNLRQAYSGTGTSASITGRTSGNTYYYRVKATRSGYADSDWRTGSNGCVVSIQGTQCGTPSSITVPTSSSTVSYSVSWGTSSTSSVTYVLEEATNTGFTSNLRQAYSGAGTSASITGRTSGNTYYYRVKATRSGYTDSAWRTGSNGCVVDIASPAIGLNRTQLNFGSVIGGQKTDHQVVVVSNTGEGTLNWTAVGEAAWIGIAPASGTGTGSVTVSVNPAGLTAGTYNSQVTFTAPGATNSPQTVNVRLRVYAAANTTSPIGSFDTPASGATVYGAIPVTGWALDDIQVTRVEIKRSPHPTDTGGMIGPDGLVFISDAIFVDGARPDVEPLYPQHPLQYRSGWGYMLLTNMLPNQGNATFTLHAFAFDKEGNQLNMGQKTITGNNAGSVKPFGAIDTPAQGQQISGAAYNNFGWALTPLPATIPIDGSTIWVFVNGVPLGNPSYNHYRPDIATLFPGYANTNGAVGVFTLNTTTMTNGVHTIAWGVTDNASNSEGIGSRYFSVLNTGGAEIEGEERAVSSQEQTGSFGNGNRMVVLDSAVLEGFPMNLTSPVYVTRGFDMIPRPDIVQPNLSGVVDIAIEEVERVELLFGAEALERAEKSGRFLGRSANAQSHASSYVRPDESQAEETSSSSLPGFLVVGDELRPLPIGSTLDSSTGVFAWQPGPGFIGKYTFVFVRESAGGFKDKTVVRITIVPKFN
jgi:hypothetical protein